MTYFLRLIGAFFLTLNLSCWASEVIFDYSIAPEKIDSNKIIVNNNTSIIFPDEVIDPIERAIKVSSVDSTLTSWVGLVISIFSIIFAIVIPVYLNYRNNKKSVLDDFWARQVLYPEYLKPLLDYSRWIRVNINEEFNEEKSEELNVYYSQFFVRLLHLNELANALNVSFDQENLEKKHREMQDFIAKYINLLIDGSVIQKIDGAEKTIDSSQISDNIKFKLLQGYKDKADKLTNELFNEFIKIMISMQSGNGVKNSWVAKWLVK